MASKDLPSISVLIPTLNAASVLEGCLKSIVDQDYPKEKIEIIIADIRQRDHRVVRLSHRETLGKAAALMIGF